jgi:hypothetical protein
MSQIGTDHRNVKKRHFCPACDHYHAVVSPLNPPNITGLCMFEPPTPFVIGMAQMQRAVVAEPNTPPEQIPIVRAYYPPVGPNETCSQWTPKAEGEA